MIENLRKCVVLPRDARMIAKEIEACNTLSRNSDQP
jgi:hypothetical protein